MVCLGLDEYSFSEVYNEEIAKDGEYLSKIERVAREDEILKQIKQDEEEEGKKVKYGYLYRS